MDLYEGANMKRQCENCGAIVRDPDQNFCLVCGHKLDNTSLRKKHSLRNLLIILATAAAVLAAVLYFHVFKAPEIIDPDAYVHIDGYDGYGTFAYDYDALLAGISADETSPGQQNSIGINDLRDHFSVTLICEDAADQDHLANGCTCHVQYTMDSDYWKKQGIRFVPGSESFTISGLKDTAEFDPFEELQVLWDGDDGSGTIHFEPSRKVHGLTAHADPPDNLHNGDSVLVSLTYNDSPDMDAYTRATGLIPAQTSRTYTVEGLTGKKDKKTTSLPSWDQYLTTLAQIPQEKMDELLSICEEHIENDYLTIKRSEPGTRMQYGTLYMGGCLLSQPFGEVSMPDSIQLEPNEGNYLCLILAVHEKSELYADAENTETKPLEFLYYKHFIFRNIYFDEDGEVVVNTDQIQTDNDYYAENDLLFQAGTREHLRKGCDTLERVRELYIDRPFSRFDKQLKDAPASYEEIPLTQTWELSLTQTAGDTAAPAEEGSTSDDPSETAPGITAETSSALPRLRSVKIHPVIMDGDPEEGSLSFDDENGILTVDGPVSFWNYGLIDWTDTERINLLLAGSSVGALDEPLVFYCSPEITSGRISRIRINSGHCTEEWSFISGDNGRLSGCSHITTEGDPASASSPDAEYQFIYDGNNLAEIRELINDMELSRVFVYDEDGRLTATSYITPVYDTGYSEITIDENGRIAGTGSDTIFYDPAEHLITRSQTIPGYGTDDFVEEKVHYVLNEQNTAIIAAESTGNAGPSSDYGAVDPLYYNTSGVYVVSYYYDEG